MNRDINIWRMKSVRDGIRLEQPKVRRLALANIPYHEIKIKLGSKLFQNG